MIIVTGGAGFIDGASGWKLNQMGVDDILVVDNLASSEKWKNLVNLLATPTTCTATSLLGDP